MNDLLCPECVGGKHGPRYCAGWTLNDDDQMVPCECTCTENGEQE